MGNNSPRVGLVQNNKGCSKNKYDVEMVECGLSSIKHKALLRCVMDGNSAAQILGSGEVAPSFGFGGNYVGILSDYFRPPCHCWTLFIFCSEVLLLMAYTWFNKKKGGIHITHGIIMRRKRSRTCSAQS
jgi:hypothetical protein